MAVQLTALLVCQRLHELQRVLIKKVDVPACCSCKPQSSEAKEAP